MPTENPKISAYVPQVVYDEFIKFRDEKGLSMSQAATVIFADYLGVDLSNLSEPQQTTGGLPTRIDTLEKAFFELTQKVDLINTTSRLQTQAVIQPLASFQEAEPAVEPLHELPDEPLEHRQTEIGDILTPDDNSSVNLSNLLSNLKGSPLQGKILAKRLSVSPSKISHEKGRLGKEAFKGWLQSLDPDDIKWLYVNEGAKFRGYIPADDTPQDKLELLSEWVQKSS